MSVRSIACCSALTKSENREEACAGCLPTRVRTSNPNGDRSIIGLMVTGLIGRRAIPIPFSKFIRSTPTYPVTRVGPRSFADPDQPDKGGFRDAAGRHGPNRCLNPGQKLHI